MGEQINEQMLREHELHMEQLTREIEALSTNQADDRTSIDRLLAAMQVVEDRVNDLASTIRNLRNE